MNNSSAAHDAQALREGTPCYMRFESNSNGAGDWLTKC